MEVIIYFLKKKKKKKKREETELRYKKTKTSPGFWILVRETKTKYEHARNSATSGYIGDSLNNIRP